MTPLRRPGDGDWVRTRRPVPLTPDDRLLGRREGLPAGALGVVLSRCGGWVQIEIPAGRGNTRATLRARDCRVTRRAPRTAALRVGTGGVAVARVAVGAALLLPLAHFSLAHRWARGTFDGLPSALAAAALFGTLDSAAAAVHQPGRALVYLAAVALLSRFAFGRWPRRRRRRGR